MSTATLEPRVYVQRNYLNADYGWRSWLFTLDHKRIALLYLVSVTFFFVIGGSFAVLMRIHLVEPQGALVQPETYNKLFTLHGVVMIFFFLIPSIPAVLGNFLVPLMVGARVLAIPILLLALEHLFHVGIFSPALGGDPLLFQHLFWFYSHPAVYIMILPAMGVVSEIIACFARKRIFGYKVIGFSSVAIAVLSFLVWGHHMFVTGQSIYTGLVFSVLSFLVAIPSAIKVFNWTATLYRGSISYQAPMLYALGFMGLFTMGGLTGLFLASLAVDVHLNGTYFVVAHFHYVMVGGAVMAYMGGLHYWWPKITGRLYPDLWARFAALVVFVGFNLTFFPQFMLGYLGMPRRYAVYPQEFQVLNVMSSAGASILGIGYLIPLIYLIWSMRYGPAAGPNPWGARGLEWEVPSPPPTENFEDIPVVTEEAYNYTGA